MIDRVTYPRIATLNGSHSQVIDNQISSQSIDYFRC
jgi:hypothetical protein